MQRNCDQCGGKLIGLDHIGIMVTDYDRSLDFYVNKVGFKIRSEEQMGDMKLGFLEAGTCVLELVALPNAQPRPAGIVDHVAIQVEEIEMLMCKMIEKGVVFETPDIQDNKELLGGVRNVFFRGPDQERIELFEYCNR